AGHRTSQPPRLGSTLPIRVRLEVSPERLRASYGAAPVIYTSELSFEQGSRGVGAERGVTAVSEVRRVTIIVWRAAGTWITETLLNIYRQPYESTGCFGVYLWLKNLMGSQGPATVTQGFRNSYYSRGSRTKPAGYFTRLS